MKVEFAKWNLIREIIVCFIASFSHTPWEGLHDTQYFPVGQLLYIWYFKIYSLRFSHHHICFTFCDPYLFSRSNSVHLHFATTSHCSHFGFWPVHFPTASYAADANQNISPCNCFRLKAFNWSSMGEWSQWSLMCLSQGLVWHWSLQPAQNEILSIVVSKCLLCV